MVWKNHRSPRQSDIAHSLKYTISRLGFLLLGVLFLLIVLFGANKNIGEWHDRTTEEEVDVEDIPAESIEEEHEVRDVPLRRVIYVGIGLLAAAIIIHVVLWWMLEGWSGERLRFAPQLPPVIVDEEETTGRDTEDLDRPGPNLQAAPVLEYRIYLAHEKEILESYGWVDQNETTTRIPIERAMELLVEEGLPARDAEAPVFGYEPAHQLESEGGQEVVVKRDAAYDPDSGEGQGPFPTDSKE